jgi:ABC-type dipeptide/oligopeptide/nickel transport system permease subunit
MLTHVLPNVIGPVLVIATLNLGFAILAEATLSFLGVGVQPPNSSWGTMLSSGLDLLTSAPMLTFLPGAMILLTVLSVNVVGDGLRDALDPKSRVRFEAHSGLSAKEASEGIAP